MKDIKLYELNSSQNVVKLQCKFTLFKRVINILTSASTSEELDFNLMEKAFNKVVERNDCLRIKFVKKNGKLMQYFAETSVFENIPVLEFKTEKEFNDFYMQTRKKAISYMKGNVIEPYFIKNYDGKYMIFLKVCHLVLDAYGINIIFKDLFEVYNALKNNKELPECPAKFEELLKKDLPVSLNPEFKEKNKEFFLDFFNEKETPFYAGLHGKNSVIWQKQLKNNRRAMKMFFVHNDTESIALPLDKNVIKDAVIFCQERKITLPSLLFYVCSLTASKINGNVKNILPIELCNCRGTLAEKKSAGTKVQSLGFYTTVDYEKTFNENLNDFIDRQGVLYRHIGYPDTEFEMLLHKRFKYGMLETFYSFMFSFIPYSKPNGVEIMFYTNGKFALPVYMAFMFDINSNEITLAYDYQTKIISKNDIENFHNNYENILKQILKNPDINLNKLKIKE